MTDGRVACILPASASSAEFGYLMVGAHEMVEKGEER